MKNAHVAVVATPAIQKLWCRSHYYLNFCLCQIMAAKKMCSTESTLCTGGHICSPTPFYAFLNYPNTPHPFLLFSLGFLCSFAPPSPFTPPDNNYARNKPNPWYFTHREIKGKLFQPAGKCFLLVRHSEHWNQSRMFSWMLISRLQNILLCILRTVEIHFKWFYNQHTIPNV